MRGGQNVSTAAGPDQLRLLQSFVDSHSQLAYSKILANHKGRPCAAFALRAFRYFEHTASPASKGVITDNHFRVHQSPHCPWQYGQVKSNRARQTEWAYRRAFLTNTDRSAAVAALAGVPRPDTSNIQPNVKDHLRQNR